MTYLIIFLIAQYLAITLFNYSAAMGFWNGLNALAKERNPEGYAKYGRNLFLERFLSVLHSVFWLFSTAWLYKNTAKFKYGFSLRSK